MRVALLSEYHCIGGGESNLINLCEELSKIIDVTLFCDGHLYECAIERGIDCRKINLSGKRWIKFFPLITYPTSLLKQLSQFDVIHSYSLNILPRLFFTKKPVVWTTHGYWEKPFGLRARIINMIADKVITVSSDVYKIATFCAEKQQKIYLGTNLEKYQVLRKLFNPKKIVISSIGRFQIIKGQDILLDALKIVALANPNIDFTLYFIGDLNSTRREDLLFKESLLLKAKMLNLVNTNIFFEGFKKDIIDYLRMSDFVVIPSRYESFSMVAIEALASGKPIIAPNIGGPKDIVNKPALGILFEPSNVDSLASAIIKMIVDFNTFNPDACNERAIEFSIAQQAISHLDLYRSLHNA